MTTPPDQASLIAKLTEDDIRKRLSVARLKPVDNPYPRKLLIKNPETAAVLLPLLKQDSHWHLLFIRRTENFKDRHGGQVAYPGGRSDQDDQGPEETALREAQEEIGIEPEKIRILGRLSDIITITNYQVTPVVGVMPWPSPLQLAANEVSRAFTIPLTWLADPKNHEIRKRGLPPPFPSIPVIYFKPYADETLWGASARITLNFLNALSGV